MHDYQLANVELLDVKYHSKWENASFVLTNNVERTFAKVSHKRAKQGM